MNSLILGSMPHPPEPRSWLRCFAFAVLTFLVFAAGTAAAQGSRVIVGTPTVIDGDTLRMGGSRIRLFGIDAPERGQPCFDGRPCGLLATEFLRGLVSGRILRCREEDVDRFRRVVATCEADGVDVARQLVRHGHAIPYERFSDRYVADRQEFEFVAPWDWRRLR